MSTSSSTRSSSTMSSIDNKSAVSDYFNTVRRKSSTSSSSSPSSTKSPRLSPKVQVVPHARTISYDMPLSPTDRKLLDKATFDDLDLSSQDFDFEDIFTYDKPQKRLSRVVEVSSFGRERDWSSFSFSHYSPALSARQKVNNRSKASVQEMYVKNQTHQNSLRR
jgi:hypothetical protein